MDLETFNKDLVPLLGLILQSLTAIIAIIATILIYKYQTSHSKRERTLELHKQFHDMSFYCQVYSPVWKIYLKWMYLPEKERNEYKRAVAMGWIGFSKKPGDTILREMIPNFKVGDDYIKLHYLEKINVNSLTEHESLTIFLGFWSDLWVYIDKGLIEKKLCFVFADTYGYYRLFMCELRTYIIQLQNNEFSDESIPDWIENTIHLEIFLDSLGK